MKMRKLMAVVLAVVVAISAMAISVFADETYQIPLLPDSGFSTDYSTTYEFTLPSYAFYGYFNAGDTITLNLPTNLSIYGYGADIDWYLTVNGVKVKIADVSPTPYYWEGDATNGFTVTTDSTAVVTYANGTTETAVVAYYAYETTSVNVEVGYFARNVQYSNGAVSISAMVPQSTLVSESTTVVLTAVVDADDAYTIPTGYYYDSTTGQWLPGLGGDSSYLNYWYDGYTYVYASLTDTDGTVNIYNYNGWAYTTGMNVVYNYTDATGAVATSTAYLQDILDFGSVTVADTNSSSSDGYVTIIADTSSDSATSVDLSWDHTLYYRSLVMNAAITDGATAKVVVDLSGYGTGYIYGYGVYTLLSNAESVDSETSYSGSDLWWTTSAASLGLYNKIASTYVLNGTTSVLEFEIDPSILYDTTYGLYSGSFVITQQATLADNTSSGYNYSNAWYGVDLSVADGGVYLELTFPADDDAVVENDDPVEDTNTETEDDELEVDDTDDTTETETNPTTGIVLALVPMAVAAAAAVASKRR